MTKLFNLAKHKTYSVLLKEKDEAVEMSYYYDDFWGYINKYNSKVRLYDSEIKEISSIKSD